MRKENATMLLILQLTEISDVSNKKIPLNAGFFIACKVAEGERPTGEVTQGERASPEGGCRIKLYSGTDFVLSGEAAI